MTAPSHDTPTLQETVAATLADHPVSVGFLFGSHARGEALDLLPRVNAGESQALGY
jgi:hypothetical protein